MAKSRRNHKLENRISAALEELRVAYVPESTRLMLCSGIRAAMNILTEGQQTYGMDCGTCGRALMSAELSRHFRVCSAPGDLAAFSENIVEPAAMEAGWGMCPGPVCPSCVPRCTDPIIAGLIEELNGR